MIITDSPLLRRIWSRSARSKVAATTALAIGALICGHAPAAADFRLCNNTSSRVGIALGYKDVDGWTTEGWWNVSSRSCETLLRGALAAMPEAAASRRRVDTRGSEITIDDLRRGIDNGEFYAAFQPKIDLATGNVTGCEALARWDSAAFGPVGPDLFIPLAEQGGLIRAMTLRMLRDSMAFAAAFLPTEPKFVVAVNLSATLLSDTSLPEEVERLLVEIGVPARSLMIEVTETTAMADVGRAMDVLLRLRLKGIGISMDDFGTGYSSLSYLRSFPFDKIKIDQSFVRGLCDNRESQAIVRAIISLGNGLGVTITAEGVESEAELSWLRAEGCQEAQGFLFSHARPNAEITGLLELQQSGASVGTPFAMGSARVA